MFESIDANWLHDATARTKIMEWRAAEFSIPAPLFTRKPERAGELLILAQLGLHCAGCSNVAGHDIKRMWDGCMACDMLQPTLLI